MTPHELTTAATARLSHWWELHGTAANPTPAIRRILAEMAPATPHVRREVEAHLHEEWARLCAREGGER